MKKTLYKTITGTVLIFNTHTHTYIRVIAYLSNFN